MKILLTCETFSPRVGGAEVHVSNLLNRLRRLGHSVTLVTNESGPAEEGVLRMVWSRKNSFGLVGLVWKSAKDVDVIHAHYCHRLAFIAGLVGLVKRKPVIVTLHGMGILDHPNAPFWGRLSHSFYRYWSLQLATRVISTSEDLAIVADKYISRKKMTIIMNGYDSDLFKKEVVEKDEFPLLKDKKIIMTVRRLVPKNGIQYLVEAIPLIIKKNPQAHCVILGDGPLREKLEKRVDELQIRSGVTFLGMVDNKLVVNHLRRADVVIFPSTAESSSIACAEAMGLGKLIVASRVGGLVELLGTNEERGYLVDLVSWSGSNYDAPETLPPDRYNELSEKVLAALEQSDVNEIKKEASRTYAENNLSWNMIVQKTISEYKKSINKNYLL